MTYLTKQNYFQFHTVYFEAAEFEWWRMLSQSPVGGSGMLYFYYISKVLCKNRPLKILIITKEFSKTLLLQ